MIEFLFGQIEEKNSRTMNEKREIPCGSTHTHTHIVF